MTHSSSLDQLRRDAKTLMRLYDAGDPGARDRVTGTVRLTGAMTHADALHVIAQERGFPTWPVLKAAVEEQGLDRATRQQRLKIALFHGQTDRVLALLDQDDTLADGLFALQVALLNRPVVEQMLAEDPARATQMYGPRRPMCHLAFSRMIHAWPDREADMLATAQLLLDHGADVDDAWSYPGSDHPLSALYGAIGHADNMALGRWLLEHGANPDDNESLYHATELSHREGLKLLLAHGASPAGTNALLRAMDFDDLEAVQLLLDHGADPNEFNNSLVGGEAPWVTPALHQAARRMCSADMVRLLLDHGADTACRFEGLGVYAAARVFGNVALVQEVEARGGATQLSEVEQVLANAADGQAQPGVYLDPAKLPVACENLIRMVQHLPGKLAHVKRLVEIGLPYDAPDREGLTPVQLAGWEGLPENLAYFLSLDPDLSHVNNYGGTLLSTIIHGSENCPQRASRDYLECLRLALKRGVALPRRQIGFAGRADVRSYLEDWAQAHPGQVI